MPYQPDKTDLKILSILQQDGRITNLQLSNEIGLSPGPTLERVKRLEKNGLIKSYHAVLDTAMLGYGIQTYMLVTLNKKGPGTIYNFQEEIQLIKEVVECHHLTGTSDYLLKIVARDISSYEKLVMERIAGIEGIGNLQTMVVLSTLKQTSSLPLEIAGEEAEHGESVFATL